MNLATENPERWNKTDFWLEKAKKPDLPPVLPIPLLLTPPNGKYGFAYCNIQSLMATVPDEVRFRNFSAFLLDLLNRYSAKGFSPPLMKFKMVSKSS